MSYKENVMNALKTVIDPWMGIDYVTARMVKVDEAAQTVKIELGYPARHMIESVKGNVEAALKTAGIEVAVEVEQKIVAHAVQRTLKVLPNVKNIIAVSSGGSPACRNDNISCKKRKKITIKIIFPTL